MRSTRTLILMILPTLIFSCRSKESYNGKPPLFAKDNLVAWCVVPFDTMHRTPEERAHMLNDLGIEQFAYDWRLQHLPTFPEEVRMLREHHIRLNAVWMWIDPDSSADVLDQPNHQLLEMIRQNNVKTDLWLGFGNRYFEGLTDEQKLDKAVTAVRYIAERAKELDCTISLYNHGDWFGEPLNQVRIISRTGLKDIGIVYNFHHAHLQIKEFPSLLEKMLPYLRTVNINGMKTDGPKILPVGQGDQELEMLKVLKASGYSGPIGILGHVEDEDIKVVLSRNIEGLKSLLKTMEDGEALDTY